ncbi:MAG: hypothetical protein MSG64_14635 [Pyrinomonadaceae bacterium MAG19_C2-C3]|nr:hypothetical protein [Pyrinomonadaceae bacterium MAG19_C2-C3]
MTATMLLTIVGLSVAGVGAGLGLGVGLRLLRVGTAARRLLHKENGEAAEAIKTASLAARQDRRRLSRPEGTSRVTSIHGVTRTGLLRHTDGSFTKAYVVEMPSTLLADDRVVDQVRNSLARMLACIKMPNVVVQFRHAVTPDPGEIIKRHLDNQCALKHSYIPARSLHTLGIAQLHAGAETGAYQRATLSLWIRIPIKQAGDPSRARMGALAAFFPATLREIRRGGIFRFSTAVSRAWTRTNRDRIVQRLREDEEEAMDNALGIFAQIEQICKLRIRPLSREELWRAIYRGHRRNEHTSPRLADIEGADLRAHLCGEDITGKGDFLMHGNTPVAVVTMFRPPTPEITADMMRNLTANPTLVCEHTDITEFITLDQARAKEDLKHQHVDLSRAKTATTRKSSDPDAEDPDAAAASEDLKGLRKEMSGNRNALIMARTYTVVCGNPVRTRDGQRAELERIETYCRHIIGAYGNLSGADAGREHPEGLRAVYPSAIVGELNPAPTGREFKEVVASLARLVPLESVWAGSPRPHTLAATPTRHLTGWDLFDKKEISSPVGVILGGPGSGKSVLGMKMIVEMLSSIAHLRVKIMDYGESCEPMVRAFGGRHLGFDPNSPQALNVWDYEGIAERVPPSELQISFVVDDALILAQYTRADKNYKFARSLLDKGVRAVYVNEIKRNRAGRPKHEPRHAHLVDWLRAVSLDEPEADACRVQLCLALEQFTGNPFIDAPTHPDFEQDSRLDVYEIKSVENFPEGIRDSLVFRITARIIQAEGRREPDGTRTKQVIAFDEMWKYIKKFSAITEIIERYVRTGRKEGVFTLLMTQAFEDIAGTPHAPNSIGHALLSTVGIKFIGLQQSGYDEMVRSFSLTPETVAAIDSIQNEAGLYSQFVGIWGAGLGQRAEKLQIELTARELWTYTTNDDERNARVRVAYLYPHLTQDQIHAWLAIRYPEGLVNKGLKTIDERLLAGDLLNEGLLAA